MDSLPHLELHDQNNPLGQDLILKLVLEHVGATDINDLLNCRLVSRAWNRVAVQVLEQLHGYALELDYKKLLKFKSLLWISRMSRMNSERQELESLRLSLTLLPKECSDLCSEIAGSAQLLALHPHIRLAFIVINYDKKVTQAEPNEEGSSWHSLANLELFTLLKLASADLIKLVIENDDQLISRFEKFEFKSYLSLEFPRLTSIGYKVNEADVIEAELVDLASHVVHIIKQAPKLMQLDLDITNGLDSTRSFLETCSATLQELALMFNGTGLTQLLSEAKFPKLRVFKAKNVYTTSGLNEFLQLNCPSLTHIHLKLDDDFEFNEDLLNSAPLPNLPNLLNFEMYSFYDTSPENTELTRALFCQLFPKFMPTNSLRLEFDIFFMLGTHLKESGHLVPPAAQYPVFPTISTLEIKIVFVQLENQEMFDVLDMATTIYHHTFPNLKTLVLEPCKGVGKRYLERAVEFLCFHPGIQNLEIYNYAQDWLNQPSIINHSLSGRLKSLKLRGPSKGNEGPHLNFVELLTRFPALEFLQVGKGRASTTEIHGLRKLMKRFENPFAINHKRTH